MDRSNSLLGSSHSLPQIYQCAPRDRRKVNFPSPLFGGTLATASTVTRKANSERNECFLQRPFAQTKTDLPKAPQSRLKLETSSQASVRFSPLFPTHTNKNKQDSENGVAMEDLLPQRLPAVISSLCSFDVELKKYTLCQTPPPPSFRLNEALVDLAHCDNGGVPRLEVQGGNEIKNLDAVSPICVPEVVRQDVGVKEHLLDRALHYAVEVEKPHRFAQLPRIDPATGNLHFALRQAFFGSCLLTISLLDLASVSFHSTRSRWGCARAQVLSSPPQKLHLFVRFLSPPNVASPPTCVARSPARKVLFQTTRRVRRSLPRFAARVVPLLAPQLSLRARGTEVEALDHSAGYQRRPFFIPPRRGEHPSALQLNPLRMGSDEVRTNIESQRWDHAFQRRSLSPNGTSRWENVKRIRRLGSYSPPRYFNVLGLMEGIRWGTTHRRHELLLRGKRPERIFASSLKDSFKRSLTPREKEWGHKGSCASFPRVQQRVRILEVKALDEETQGAPVAQAAQEGEAGMEAATAALRRAVERQCHDALDGADGCSDLLALTSDRVQHANRKRVEQALHSISMLGAYCLWLYNVEEAQRWAAAAAHVACLVFGPDSVQYIWALEDLTECLLCLWDVEQSIRYGWETVEAAEICRCFQAQDVSTSAVRTTGHLLLCVALLCSGDYEGAAVVLRRSLRVAEAVDEHSTSAKAMQQLRKAEIHALIAFTLTRKRNHVSAASGNLISDAREAQEALDYSYAVVMSALSASGPRNANEATSSWSRAAVGAGVTLSYALVQCEGDTRAIAVATALRQVSGAPQKNTADIERVPLEAAVVMALSVACRLAVGDTVLRGAAVEEEISYLKLALRCIVFILGSQHPIAARVKLLLAAVYREADDAWSGDGYAEEALQNLQSRLPFPHIELRNGRVEAARMRLIKRHFQGAREQLECALAKRPTSDALVEDDPEALSLLVAAYAAQPTCSPPENVVAAVRARWLLEEKKAAFCISDETTEDFLAEAHRGTLLGTLLDLAVIRYLEAERDVRHPQSGTAEQAAMTNEGEVWKLLQQAFRLIDPSNYRFLLGPLLAPSYTLSPRCQQVRQLATEGRLPPSMAFGLAHVLFTNACIFSDDLPTNAEAGAAVAQRDGFSEAVATLELGGVGDGLGAAVAVMTMSQRLIGTESEDEDDLGDALAGVERAQQWIGNAAAVSFLTRVPKTCVGASMKLWWEEIRGLRRRVECVLRKKGKVLEPFYGSGNSWITFL